MRYDWANGPAIELGIAKLEASSGLDGASRFTEVTHYLGDGAIGFLLPNGKALDVVGARHDNWSHRLAAQFAGTTIDELEAAGVARVYAVPGDALEISTAHRPTAAQVATLANAVTHGVFWHFRVYGGKNISSEAARDRIRITPIMVCHVIDINWPAV